jgi:intracellular sulfur oxidation DsrE/DsrF family protein
MFAKRFAFTLLLIVSFVAWANSDQEVENLLSRTEAPEGVVFEIVASADGLTWAIPKVKAYIARIHQRFPGVPIAIVTHGNEQFALQKKNAKKYGEVQNQVQSLVQDDNIQVHVCGTYAEMNGVDPEEFPDHVDVAAAGPAQINDYVAVGYELIQVTK